jgi:hypothetical protein
MRILFSLAAIVALSGCLPRATEPLRAVPVVEPRPSLPLRAPTNPEPPSAPHDDPPHSPPQEATVRRATRSGIGLTGVSFDSRLNRLVVADQPAGPNSKWRDGAAAAKAVGGIAAINGGFFTPEGEPLGLAIASGAASGTWNRASALGSGIWHDGRISRREAIGQTAARSGRELLQSGPMLVENGTPVSKLNAGKLAVRSVILWDGGTRWWIGVTTPCTLSALAAALAERGPDDWTVACALNLDGGRSSEVWISPDVRGGPHHRRPSWNRPVRNFLVLLPK